MRQIDYIIIHCSAGALTSHAGDIVSYHLRPTSKGGRGWRAPGYHYIIEADGNTVNTWPEEQISNGVKGYNSRAINVCYIGGVDVTTKGLPPMDTRTEAQKEALIGLIKKLRVRYPKAKIVGHRDLSPDKNHDGIIEKWEWVKACPSFDAKEEYEGL